jgi:hypothetical protein
VSVAQTQWAGLVNVPVGSTDFGLGFGSTAAGTKINQSETATGTPTKTDGSTGLSQSGLDNQRSLTNFLRINKMTLGSEQVASSIGGALELVPGQTSALSIVIRLLPPSAIPLIPN